MGVSLSPLPADLAIFPMSGPAQYCSVCNFPPIKKYSPYFRVQARVELQILKLQVGGRLLARFA